MTTENTPENDVPASGEATKEMPAAQETSSVSEPQFLYADTGAAAAGSSQRARFIPPDSKAATLWKRHKNTIILLETVLTALFFLLALFFLYRWLTREPPVAYAPDRAGFLAALAARDPVEAEDAWRVDAVPGRWRGIVVHHTATPRGSVASIDRYHREENKWPNGLGYHFLIGNGDGMEDGEVGVGPRWTRQLDGAHVRMKGTSKANSYSVGIALVGNFEDRVPSARQLASLRGVLRFLTKEYGISRDAVAGHGQVSEKFTACPGKLLFVDEVVKALG